MGVCVASAGPYANNLYLVPGREPHQHLITQFIYRLMLFVMANQQRQSTEGTSVWMLMTDKRSCDKYKFSDTLIYSN